MDTELALIAGAMVGAIRICECGAIFAGKGKQMRCTKACGNRARARKFYASHKNEVLAKRRSSGHGH